VGVEVEKPLQKYLIAIPPEREFNQIVTAFTQSPFRVSVLGVVANDTNTKNTKSDTHYTSAPPVHTEKLQATFRACTPLVGV
jgi:hypothetical protein